MRHYFFDSSRKHKYLIACSDAVLIAGTILFSYLLREYFNSNHFSMDLVLKKINLWQTIIIPLHMFTLYVLDLYNLNRVIYPVKYSIKVFLSIVLAGIIISGIFFFFPKYVFGRQVFLIHLFLLSVLLIIWRLIVLKIFASVEAHKKIALLCSRDIAIKFAGDLSKIGTTVFEISHVCLTDDENESKSCISINNAPIACSSLSELLTNNQFDVLVFDSSNNNFSNEAIRMILETKQKGKTVYDLPNIYKNITGKIPVEYINGKWLLNRDDLQGMISRPYIHMKRILDIVMSCFMILILLPLIAVLALIIRLESKGPFIFAQERLGRNRKPFMCYKFRTMVDGAEKKSGPVWSRSDDPRITFIGKILRKTRLDELPQLWNILKGDISFVGPRPIRKHFADLLSKDIPFYELRFCVQPGLSGWAQVNHDYAGSVDGQHEKFQFELFYIENMSLFLDIITIFKTFQSVFKAEGK